MPLVKQFVDHVLVRLRLFLARAGVKCKSSTNGEIRFEVELFVHLQYRDAWELEKALAHYTKVITDARYSARHVIAERFGVWVSPTSVTSRHFAGPSLDGISAPESSVVIEGTLAAPPDAPGSTSGLAPSSMPIAISMAAARKAIEHYALHLASMRDRAVPLSYVDLHA